MLRLGFRGDAVRPAKAVVSRTDRCASRSDTSSFPKCPVVEAEPIVDENSDGDCHQYGR